MAMIPKRRLNKGKVRADGTHIASFLMSRLVMPRTAHRARKSDPFDMFCFASLYQQGATALFIAEAYPQLNWQNRTLSGLFVPRSILLSLSFELYLKCLKRLRGKAPLMEHRTNLLYEDLSIRDRQRINRQFALHRTSVMHNEPQMRFQNVIDRTSRYFFDMRYGYEQQTTTLIVGLDDAAEAVRKVILISRPGWHQMYLDRENFV